MELARLRPPLVPAFRLPLGAILTNVQITSVEFTAARTICMFINGMLLLVNIFSNCTPVSRHLIYAKRRRNKYKLGGWGGGVKKTQTKNFCYLAETYLTHTASASFSIDPQKPFKNLYLWYINGSTSVYKGCRVFVKQTKSKTRKSVAQQSVQNTHMCLLNYECDFKHQTCWTGL